LPGKPEGLPAKPEEPKMSNSGRVFSNKSAMRVAVRNVAVRVAVCNVAVRIAALTVALHAAVPSSPAAPSALPPKSTPQATSAAPGAAPAKVVLPPKADPKVVIDPKADPKAVVDQALKAYEGGHYGDAVALLAADLQNNPNDGQVHYYLGLALKKQGYDMSALHELEKAARLCPPAMIKRFADEQIGNLDEPEPIEGKPAAAPAANNDWFGGLTNSLSQMFGGKPATAPANGTGSGSGPGAGAGTTGGAAPAPTRVASVPSAGQFSFPGMPDFMGQLQDAVKQGKKMLRQAKDKGVAGVRTPVDFSRGRVGEAEIMHMDDMQDLVEKSHAIGVKDWGSNPEGLTAFLQAPESTPEWDYWIGRFKRSFQHVLMRRLNAEAANQVRGAAACIFSVDRDGNLRGQIYASTADPALNKCLVEAIRDLNHSRILRFPSTSRITGWNFQMSWNFGVYMAIVKSYRQELQREATIQALLKLVKEDASIKATIKAGEEKRAKAKRLAAEKALNAKLSAKLKAIPVPPVAKAEVSGHIVVKPAERELRAVALELKDLSPVAPDASKPNEDPFANINDQTINSWPDLNR
jgi:tetratricopeptide (TPR) repeat protein